MSTQGRLGRDDWAWAALQVIIARGPDGVAVERLANELGATKGSFYWHFKNRDEVIAAAAELWERRATADVIDRVDATDPQRRLSDLSLEAFGSAEDGVAEAALVGHRSHPVIGEVVERVTRRRVAYVAELLAATGLAPADAQARAVVIYATYLGYFQIAAAVPGLLVEVDGDTVSALMQQLVEPGA